MSEFKIIKSGKTFHKSLQNIQKERMRDIDRDFPKWLGTERLTEVIFKDSEMLQHWRAIESKLRVIKRKEQLK